MISEILLDLFPFKGTESVIEIYEDKPVFEDACFKRVNNYQGCSFEKSNFIKDANLFILLVSSRNIKMVCKFLNQKRNFPFHFILIAENKFGFHKVCNVLEGNKRVASSFKADVSLRSLKKLTSFSIKPKIYQVFQDLKNPVDIRKIGIRNESYLISRSSRTNGKRTFGKFLSVLLELIFIRHLQINALAPAYVIIGEKE